MMSAEVLEVGWRRVTLVEMTSASERARPAAQLRRSPITLSLTPFSSAHARLVSRQSSLRTRHRLQLRARALSPCALHTCTAWHDIRNGMAWTQRWHGHRDDMDTGMAWTQDGMDTGMARTP